MIETAAILARGLGTRMRREEAGVTLSDAQGEMASAGAKGMIPIGRPFLEYVISALADSGITEVVLVIGPEHDAVRRHFTSDVSLTRIRVAFAEQREPRGTADAVVAAAGVVGTSPFLVLNADNYYPVASYRALRVVDGAGVVAYDRDALVECGNIDAERVRSFAVLDVAEDDTLRAIVEKPGASLDLTAESARWVGMNLWAVTPAIVSACVRVPRSSRGEHELPEAVGLAISEGTRVQVVRQSAAVLDLSRRSDIASVAAALSAVEVRL